MSVQEEDLGVGRIVEPETPPQSGANSHVVEFRNVTKTYNVGLANEFTAIKDVGFVVRDLPGQGEFVSVLGPSGCGKSTILRLIAGLQPQHPPTTGEVHVLGEQVTAPAADRGMVFLDNVVFGLECLGMPRKQRYELGRMWIEKVGLNIENDQSKYPHELSGGMRQRVAIARTLILRPKIILMDEPFGALDPQTRMNMQDLLVALWREVEATVFFVTHSIDEAVYLGDRIFLFSNSPGKILEEIAVEPPDRPAREMQREQRFQDTVYHISDTIGRLEAAASEASGESG